MNNKIFLIIIPSIFLIAGVIYFNQSTNDTVNFKNKENDADVKEVNHPLQEDSVSFSPISIDEVKESMPDYYDSKKTIETKKKKILNYLQNQLQMFIIVNYLAY